MTYTLDQIPWLLLCIGKVHLAFWSSAPFARRTCAPGCSGTTLFKDEVKERHFALFVLCECLCQITKVRGDALERQIVDHDRRLACATWWSWWWRRQRGSALELHYLWTVSAAKSRSGSCLSCELSSYKRETGLRVWRRDPHSTPISAEPPMTVMSVNLLVSWPLSAPYFALR